ncbi:Ctr copper transporter, partial [Acaromyces ingoldii]
MSMSGMDMDSTDMSSGSCSMSMLGNWETIGSCFLTSSWHISTAAQFAGTCIGVFLIVVVIESVRRWGREWDRYIVRKALEDHQRMSNLNRAGNRAGKRMQTTKACFPMFRPSVLQQAIRSLVYAIQFTGAYIVMLIAMSYNGYILISIVLGGLVGHFFSTWDTLSFALD